MTENIAAFAPTPSPSVSTTAKVKPGLARRPRSAYRRSCKSESSIIARPSLTRKRWQRRLCSQRWRTEEMYADSASAASTRVQPHSVSPDLRDSFWAVALPSWCCLDSQPAIARGPSKRPQECNAHAARASCPRAARHPPGPERQRRECADRRESYDRLSVVVSGHRVRGSLESAAPLGAAAFARGTAPCRRQETRAHHARARPSDSPLPAFCTARCGGIGAGVFASSA